MSRDIKWKKISYGVFRVTGENINLEIEADEVTDMGRGYFLLCKDKQKKLIALFGGDPITCIDWGEHEIARPEDGENPEYILRIFTWKVDGKLVDIEIDCLEHVSITPTVHY